MLLSYLIPTYKRYPRLRRNLDYFICLSRHQSLNNIELLIADGSPEDFDIQGKSELMEMIDRLKGLVNIKYKNLPGLSWPQRQSWLFQNSQGETVAFLGDEDIPVVDEALHLSSQLLEDDKLSAIAGRYIAIKGIYKKKLLARTQESWIHGLHIASANPLTRFLQYANFYHVGIPPIYYSILSRKAMENYLDDMLPVVNRISYSDTERLMNMSVCLAGEVKFVDKPYLLRDFTFLDHSSQDPRWEFDDKSFINAYMAELITVKYDLFNSEQLAKEFIDNLLPKVLKSGASMRNQVQFYVELLPPFTLDRAPFSPSSEILESAANAWISSISTCYKKQDIESVNLTFVNRIKTKVKSLMRRH